MKTSIVILFFILMSTIFVQAQFGSIDLQAYQQEIKKNNENHLKYLKSEKGWLNLAGLFWLNEGENTFGAGEENAIIFPEKAADKIGKFVLNNGEVQMHVNEGVEVMHSDTKITTIDMQNDRSGNVTLVQSGDLAWFIIKRGDRYGVRLRDYAHPNITKLTEIKTFLVDPVWRVEATLVKKAHQIEMPNVLGEVDLVDSPGTLVFSIDGKDFELVPTQEGNMLFVVFGDQTSGFSTYGAGRFLEIPMPDETGKTIIDFNKAYNPPCAFTHFATCPIPPFVNILELEVTAGEKTVDLLH